MAMKTMSDGRRVLSGSLRSSARGKEREQRERGEVKGISVVNG